MVIGQFVSIFGAAVLRFALSLYVLDLTGRADVFGLILALSALPGILASPVSGVIADRFNRRNLMVIFDFSSCLITGLFLSLLLGGAVSVPLIGIVTALLALISAMYQPVVQASIPLLVAEESLEKSNGIVNAIGNVSSFAGPVLGGLVYQLVGLHALVIFGAAAFFLSAVTELFIRIPHEKREIQGSPISDFIKDGKAGFRYMIRENPFMLRILTVAALSNLIIPPFFTVGVLYVVREVMHSSDLLYGINQGMMQLSFVLGALMIGLFTSKLHLATLYKWFFYIALFIGVIALAMSPLIQGVGYWPGYILLSLALLPIGIILSVLSLYMITLVQKGTPNHMMGKVMAVGGALSQCAMPLGQLIVGFLFQAFAGAVYVPALLTGALVVALAFGAKTLLAKGSPQRV